MYHLVHPAACSRTPLPVFVSYLFHYNLFGADSTWAFARGYPFCPTSKHPSSAIPICINTVSPGHHNRSPCCRKITSMTCSNTQVLSCLTRYYHVSNHSVIQPHKTLYEANYRGKKKIRYAPKKSFYNKRNFSLERLKELYHQRAT